MNMFRISDAGHLGTMLLVVACLGLAQTSSQTAPVMSISTTVVANGAAGQSSVDFHSHGTAVAGVQFDLEYDHNAVTITASLGPTAAAAEKSLSSVILPNGNLRVLIIGFNQNVIGNGSIVELTVQMSTYAAPGPYNLRFLNVAGVTPNGDPVHVQTRDGRVVAIPPTT